MFYLKKAINILSNWLIIPLFFLFCLYLLLPKQDKFYFFSLIISFISMSIAWNTLYLIFLKKCNIEIDIPKITGIAITQLKNDHYISISLPISLYNNGAKEKKTIVRNFSITLLANSTEEIKFDRYYYHDIEYVILNNGLVNTNNLKHTNLKPSKPIIISGTSVESFNLCCRSCPGKYQFSEKLFKLKITFNTSEKRKNIHYYDFTLAEKDLDNLYSTVSLEKTGAELIFKVLDIPLNKIKKKQKR